MKRSGLTSGEKQIMNIFWSEQKPLTSIDLQRLIGDDAISIGHIHKLLRALKKNGYIEISGVELGHRRDIRQYTFLISKEEYVTGLIDDQGLTEKSLSQIAISLLKKNSLESSDKEREELADQLEAMIEQFRNKKESG